ncbi:hypothetical protein KC327_g17474 [Hortaea werneckii]|nr:hypothetical protein KC327_g17474 [Hortaea werneckii]KAI7115026.1 hypothetical protein KC337_g17315 [Hortaea werneckii]
MSHPSPPSASTTATTTTADSELGSPVESLSAMSIHDGTSTSTPLPKAPAPLMLPRPDMSARSATDPSPSALLQNYFASTVLHEQPPLTTRRNRSPYSRSHLRSRSGGSSGLSAPPITRAKSLPTQHAPRASSSTTPNQSSSESTRSNSGSTSPAFAAPLSGSPARSPRRLNSPFRDDAPSTTPPPPPRSPSFSGGTPAIESIQEDSELDFTPRQTNTLPQPPSAAAMTSFSRSGSLRRRPASPLHSLNNPTPPPPPPTSTPSSSYPTSPAIRPVPSPNTPSSTPHTRQPSLERFRDEPHPTTTTPLTLHTYPSTSSFQTSSSSISIPSTPTSARSRSPSISSLETIEDAPDLESEAVEVERKIAAERAARIARGEEVADESSQYDGAGGGTGLWRRRSLDTPGVSGSGGRGGLGVRVGGTGGGYAGTTTERKRWSICGGERRADLDLETIWED